MKKLVMYRRASDLKQKSRIGKNQSEQIIEDVEEDGLGLQAQDHMCRTWAINNEDKDIEILVFTDIVTGTDKGRKELTKRPALMDAIATLEAGDVFIVAKRDRLGRDTYVNCMIERLIERKGATMVSACGDMGSGDDPHNILMRRIMDAFAEYEALLISTRTRAALSRKKAKGERLGHIPYGYMEDSKKNLIVNHEEAQILRLMYQMRVDKKMPFREIANRLNQLGYRNRGTAKEPATPWTHGATSRLYKSYPKICDHVFSTKPKVEAPEQLVFI